MADQLQQQIDAELEKSIADDIKKDLGTGKPEKTDPPNPDNTDDDGGDVKNRKKNIDKKKKNTDTDTDKPDETEVFDQVVQKVLQDEYDGDESRLSEAKAVANVAIKTFNGDPVKAAKSYHSLYRQYSDVNNTLKGSPFIEKLVQAAKDGKTVDENYVQSLLGTATSDADQPKKPKETMAHDQLEDDDFDVDSITTDQLFESGILDKDRYEDADAIDRKDMVNKARLRYAYKVLPEKMAERTVTLTQQKEAQKRQKDAKATAINTNKQRMSDNLQEVITKYDVDFEGNPHHAQLWDEVKKTIYRVPDISDDSGMLIAENAVEQAVRHVFSKHNVTLNPVDIASDAGDKPDQHKVDRMSSGSMEAMARILGDANGFKGRKTGPTKGSDSEDNSLDSRVSKQVEANLNRSYQTTNIISGQRKTDRKKPN